jgi:hypothetical protein
MPRSLTPLALIASVAIIAATMVAMANGEAKSPSRPSGDRAAETVDQRSWPANRAPLDPTDEVTRGYALAVRNWTQASYGQAWERQMELSAGPLTPGARGRTPKPRRGRRAAPGRSEGTARILEAERDRRVRAPAGDRDARRDDQRGGSDGERHNAQRGPAATPGRPVARGRLDGDPGRSSMRLGVKAEGWEPRMPYGRRRILRARLR